MYILYDSLRVSAQMKRQQYYAQLVSKVYSGRSAEKLNVNEEYFSLVRFADDINLISEPALPCYERYAKGKAKAV